MGMYSAPKIKYTAPPPDNTFAEYLKLQQKKDDLAQQRADAEKADAKAEEQARKAAGASAYGGLRSTTQQQLSLGLIDYQTAANQLRDYAAKYDLTPPEEDISALTKQYTSSLPSKRRTGIEAAYEELLGRAPSKQEISKSQERFTQGYYGSMEDFKDSLSKSQEYQKKFNSSYLDNYYDTQFGKQTVDAKGEKTGERTFKFDSSLLPKYAGNLEGRTKITTPDFGKSFTGTPAELQEQTQNIRDTRQYLYSAGLTNLQGKIDKETQSLKNEGSKQVAKIGAAGSLYSNLVSGFWG
jgi:hypothetical protein